MTNSLRTRRAHIEIDPTHDARILLVIFSDRLDSTVLRLTPAQAARLGQRLIDTAARMEQP